ncbi:ferrichrome ABC transporter substrate-binding protein [Paenibacillus pectinilyticus]|uniref:Ferrichrome ABC transporter substrate-binding protein n=1 Tax=Paenibacillus pectinilyticus TaxID=512399 RepID=A0A1C1A6F0_9BACL|nr:ABC transporter substrate-binding protein [Paenibacillus pectinilyticus]OCT16141.1 ferrichrome ABC transporter substrate-binding protein [Paenibacillus pectinilyticus]
MKQASVKIGMAVLLLSLTAACGQGTKTETTATPAASAVAKAAATPAATPAPSAAPKVAIDEAKATELLAQFKTQNPSKVVTVSVGISEILNELGVMPVGVPTTASKMPAAYANITKIGTSHAPDLEQIAKLTPDVILGPASIKDSLEKQFVPAKLPTAYIPVDSLDELKLSTVVLGRLFKQEAKATAVIEKTTTEEAAARELGKGKPAPKVLILFGSAESLMFMNENTFTGSLVKQLGASNVVSDVLKLKDAYVPLNMESIVTANPDAILLVAHGDPAAVAKKFEEDLKKNGAWEKLNAFKNGKFKSLDYNLYGIASIINAPAAFKDLGQVLYK